MLTFTAQTIRGQLGNIFDDLESDPSATVLIERNNKPVAMLLPASVGRMVILSSYAHGNVSRNMAMRQLGYKWYGELLDGLAQAGIERPVVQGSERQSMIESALAVLPRPSKPKASKP